MMREKRSGAICTAFRMITIWMIFLMLSGCGSDRVSYERNDDKTEEVDLRSAEQTEVSETVSEHTGSVCVYVCGAVVKEGVYQLPEGSRINDALIMAGGLTEDAASGALNLAETVQDGQKLYFPTKEEFASRRETITDEADTGGQEESGDESTDKIDINTADKEQLMTLSGIGEAKAEAILRYRKDTGSFGQIEDIMNVDGIGESLFQKIKEYIYVK